MTKQPLTVSLHPDAVALLDRALKAPDKTRLTRSQIAQIMPLQRLIESCRIKLNLMARSDVIARVGHCDIYPHPDRREEGAMMIYDERSQDLHIDTPFTSIPRPGHLTAWLKTATTN